MEHLHFASPNLKKKPRSCFCFTSPLVHIHSPPPMSALLSLDTDAPKPCFQLLHRLEQLHKWTKLNENSVQTKLSWAPCEQQGAFKEGIIVAGPAAVAEVTRFTKHKPDSWWSISIIAFSPSCLGSGFLWPYYLNEYRITEVQGK